MIVRYKANVKGKVQCVSFRNFTEICAILLGINGTVENKGTAEVEVFMEGEKEMIERLLKAVTLGPKRARVDEFVFTEEKVTGEVGFTTIRPPQPVYNWGELSYLPKSLQPTGKYSLCDICDGVIYGSPIIYNDPESGIWEVCKPCGTLLALP
jgi:acylphosphatase